MECIFCVAYKLPCVIYIFVCISWQGWKNVNHEKKDLVSQNFLKMSSMERLEINLMKFDLN